jgi:SAM-dependent methyltransferase
LLQRLARLIAPDDFSAARSDFFEGENVKKVLDASCGSGEQAIALAGLGLNVTACDPSGGLVKRCAENAAHFGVEKNVRAQQSDFLNLAKDFKGELGTFDAIVTKGSSLPHLHTNSDLRQALTVWCLPASKCPTLPFRQDRQDRPCNGGNCGQPRHTPTPLAARHVRLESRWNQFEGRD